MQESELLRHIASRSSDLNGLESAWGRIEVGPGDDAAVVRTPAGDALLITVDQLVIGRHFPEDAPIDLIARKAVARSVSDIAAMGGTPAWALATGLLPTGYPHADDLFEAMARWARGWGCPLIGGDIAAGPGPLSLTVTIAGTMVGGAKPVLRGGAKPGDHLWLTGPVGGSFESGRHASFEPRLEAGQRAAALGAYAMMDISDGLGRDAARIGEASGVRLRVESGRIPLHEGVSDWRKGASDGEDYELLIAMDPSMDAAAHEASWLGPIGEVDSGPAGAVIVDADGIEHDAAAMGWDH